MQSGSIRNPIRLMLSTPSSSYLPSFPSEEAVRIVSAEGEALYAPTMRCDACGKRMRALEKIPGTERCPRCGSIRPMEFRDTILWDRYRGFRGIALNRVTYPPVDPLFRVRGSVIVTLRRGGFAQHHSAGRVHKSFHYRPAAILLRHPLCIGGVPPRDRHITDFQVPSGCS